MSASPVTDPLSPGSTLQPYEPSFVTPPLKSRSSSFSQRLTIPTVTDSLSSGFPYHPKLHDLNVSLDEWHLFTSDILAAGKLTTQEDYAAWTTGIATGTLTTGFILFFGPWVGYIAGKKVHKKAVIGKVKERLLQDGDMRSVLRRWNERTFAEKGFQAWLELPSEGDLKLDAEVKEKKTKAQRKAAMKEKRRFKVVIIPENDKHGYSWSNAVPAPNPAVPFVEAPQAEHKSPVELQTGATDHIQPLVNHQQEITPEEGGDRKYEYRRVPAEIRPDHDGSLANDVYSLSPSNEVANGRIPESEIIPADEKKDKELAYRYPSAFEMDSSQVP